MTSQVVANNNNKKLLYLGIVSGSGKLQRARAIAKACNRRSGVGGIELEVALFGVGGSATNLLLGDFPCRLPQGNEAPATFYLRIIKEVKPDAIICDYVFSVVEPLLLVATNNNIPAWLITHADTSVSNLQKITARLWQGIFTIEPSVTEMAEQAGLTSTIIATPGPVLSVWPDEILPRDEARKILLEVPNKLYHDPDTGQPIAVVAHNGLDDNELRQLITHAETTIPKNYSIRIFSQCVVWPNRVIFSKEPFARLLSGVDYLFAVAGYNTFYEACSYLPKFNADWVAYENRAFDANNARLSYWSQKASWALKDFASGKTNGVDFIVSHIVEALLEVSSK
jgi:hypothetical protein